jgi:hypothetical protein
MRRYTAMNRNPQEKSPQPAEEPVENFTHRPSLLGHLLARRRVQQLESRRQAHYRELARRVEQVLIGCGLSQSDFSIGGGRVFHFPEVISVTAGPPMSLDIRILPGQMPDDLTAHTRRIAYNLGVADVRVVPLGPYLVRLELLPEPD